MLIALNRGGITPPFGLGLFIMKGVVPPELGITMGTIYRAAIPYIVIGIIGMLLILFFSVIATWLPGMMG